MAALKVTHHPVSWHQGFLEEVTSRREPGEARGRKKGWRVAGERDCSFNKELPPPPPQGLKKEEQSDSASHETTRASSLSSTIRAQNPVLRRLQLGTTWLLFTLT